MQLVLPPLPILRRLSCVFSGIRAGSIRLSRELSTRETVTLYPVRQLQVSCCEGTIWVTTGVRGAGDVVLIRGERLAVAAGATVVIEGLQSARIEVSAC